MSVPKKRRSLIKIRKRRAGLYGKIKIINLNNIVVCSHCNNPRLSHKYCCLEDKKSKGQFTSKTAS